MPRADYVNRLTGFKQIHAIEILYCSPPFILPPVELICQNGSQQHFALRVKRFAA
jgi:hypothetical protein